MHQYPDTEDKYQIIDYIYVVDLHFVQKLAGFLIVTIKFFAQQVHPVESVYGIQQTVETRAKIRYVKHPAEHWRRIKVTYAEAEDGEQHRGYRANEDCDLQKITKFSVFLSCIRLNLNILVYLIVILNGYTRDLYI